MRVIRILLALVVVAAIVVAFGLGKTFHEPGDLYATMNTFAGCPARPSCVSSKAGDAEHRVAPFVYAGDAARARELLESVVRDQPRARIDHATPSYLHAVFQTPTMHFHDDVELLVEPGGTIAVRSISRFAWHDHGVNRERVETLREAFATALARSAPKRD